MDRSRLPMDPKLVREIQRSSEMVGEQGSGFMEDWGGPSMYRQMAKIPPVPRVVYYVIRGGTTEPSEIEIVTGLTSKEVSDAIVDLQRRGLVTYG